MAKIGTGMDSCKILLAFLILAATLSCRSKNTGDQIINSGLGDIHLTNKEAENDFNKGLFFVRQENYSAAKDFFLQADEESPNTPMILNAIGNCMDRTGNAQKGFTYYKKAMQIDSNFTKTYVNYGCSLNNSSRFDEAERIFRLGLVKRSLPSFDRAALYLNLADTYYHREQYEQALSILDSAKMGLTNRILYKSIIQAENQIKQEAHYPQTTR